jgi:hypothetical protein
MAVLARALAALLAVSSACALGGGDGSGDQALPVSGAGPFAKLSDPTGATPLSEPYVVIDPLASISDPAPLELADGTVRIFYTRGGSEIRRADLSASLAGASDPVSVLVATAEEGSPVAPSVVRRGGALLLYYETDGGVARASSTDDGVTFERDGIVVAGGRSPGALVVDDRVLLYFTRPGDPDIWLATSTDGLAFTVLATPVLAPSGADWDAMGLGDPAPAGGHTATGELHVGLYFTGTGMASSSVVTAIGYAGSSDGLTFEAVPAPVLDPAAPSERGPAVVVHPDHVLLLFAQDRSGKLAIAAARNP